MADDWDLHAVVRGCAATNRMVNDENNFADEIVTNFDSLNFENDDFQFYDYGCVGNAKFQGLEEIYSGFSSSLQPQLEVSCSQALVEPVSPRLDSPPLQSRRRKNQQVKVVQEMTHEELLADTWAWRKYGQKPIKGSPYPRNYYKCSTLKGCIARKQVEKSPIDPNIYIVSYSGDHCHPRPIHRNSLAGSTRNKSSTISAPSTLEMNSTSSRDIHENNCDEMEEDEDS